MRVAALAIASLWAALTMHFAAERYPRSFYLGSEWRAFWYDRIGDAVLLGWARDWQELIGAALAVAAAVTGAYLLLQQIGQTERLEAQRIRRRHRAVRATLPLALTELVDYAEETFMSLESVLSQRQGTIIPTRKGITINVPNLPLDAIDSIKEFIEFADEDSSYELAKLLAHVQINHSRMRGLAQDLAGSGAKITVVMAMTLEYYLLDAAIVYSGASQYFDYARRQLDRSPGALAWDEVQQALSRLTSPATDSDRLSALITLRESRGASPFSFAD